MFPWICMFCEAFSSSSFPPVFCPKHALLFNSLPLLLFSIFVYFYFQIGQWCLLNSTFMFVYFLILFAQFSLFCLCIFSFSILSGPCPLVFFCLLNSNLTFLPPSFHLSILFPISNFSPRFFRSSICLCIQPAKAIILLKQRYYTELAKSKQPHLIFTRKEDLCAMKVV